MNNYPLNGLTCTYCPYQYTTLGEGTTHLNNQCPVFYILKLARANEDRINYLEKSSGQMDELERNMGKLLASIVQLEGSVKKTQEQIMSLKTQYVALADSFFDTTLGIDLVEILK